MLALLLDLRETRVLQPIQDRTEDGIGLGRVGQLKEASNLSLLVARVKALLGLDTVRVLGNRDQEIQRVALVGGSGGRMVSAAAQAGADLLITGDIGHHDALEAVSLGLSLIDGGHFHTEKAALRLFSDRIRLAFNELGWNVGVEFYDEEASPWRYE